MTDGDLHVLHHVAGFHSRHSLSSQSGKITPFQWTKFGHWFIRYGIDTVYGASHTSFDTCAPGISPSVCMTCWYVCLCVGDLSLAEAGALAPCHRNKLDTASQGILVTGGHRITLVNQH